MGTFARQISAGCIVGLSAVIYAISYGALLFSGPLAGDMPYGIAAALITAGIGALFGWHAQERSFVSGPDANTISVLAALLAAVASVSAPAEQTLQRTVATLFTTSLVCAAAFYLLARFKLAGLVRYFPFSVIAGLLAATGWLMCSGALNIVADTPLSVSGLERFLANPWRPELLLALAVVVALTALAPVISPAILIPAVMLLTTLVVNAAVASSMCTASACHNTVWMFAGMHDIAWLPPWQYSLGWADVRVLAGALPSMLVAAFVGLLTILLSLASLELSYQKEFDLNQALKAHAASTGLTALLGGFVGIISIGRTTLNRAAGGAALSGAIAAAACLAMLLGAGDILTHIPKAALGGLVLFLGLNMLKQWLLDQRKATSRDEFMQIVLIVVVVANYGYLAGFAVGVLISCMVFVLTYSSTPLASLATTLAVLPSSVLRSGKAIAALESQGHRTLIYRLQGYMFFGSASKIDTMFHEMDIDAVDCVILDFSNVNGIDLSAIGVLQRILRRYRDRPLQFYFVYADGRHQALRSIAADQSVTPHIAFFASLDYALEAAEELALGAQHSASAESLDCFDFLEHDQDRERFRSFCAQKQVPTEALLCRDGEFSDAIYFVEQGSFEVIQTNRGATRHRLAKISQGAMVGEMAFYTGQARSASIVAVQESSVYALDTAALQRMRELCPELAMRFDHVVIEKLAHALKRANRLSATLG